MLQQYSFCLEKKIKIFEGNNFLFWKEHRRTLRFCIAIGIPRVWNFAYFSRYYKKREMFSSHCYYLRKQDQLRVLTGQKNRDLVFTVLCYNILLNNGTSSSSCICGSMQRYEAEEREIDFDKGNTSLLLRKSYVGFVPKPSELKSHLYTDNCLPENICML